MPRSRMVLSWFIFEMSSVLSPLRRGLHIGKSINSQQPIGLPDGGTTTMDWLNYHHLFYFWTVVREGGVSKASKVLRLAQPTVSGQIKALENAPGTRSCSSARAARWC
jgi:hypothetical protein